MTKPWSNAPDSGFTKLFVLLLVCLSMTASAKAQSLVHADEVRELNRFFDQQVSVRNSLPCHIYGSSEARMNFLFQYSAGFGIECGMGKILPGDTLLAFIRVKPSQGEPVLLSEEFDVPKPSAGQFAPLQQAQIFLSGGFTLGEGSYSAEVILTDQNSHICRKSWKLRANGHNRQRVPAAGLKPGTVEPPLDASWDGKLDSDGARLTVLLLADPGGAFSVWDRAIALQSLTSLLGQAPWREVRVIAFSLDQVAEIFRQERFDGDGFTRLSKALEHMQTATVPYQALQKHAWEEFLIELVQKETSAKEAPDAVVFVGPAARFDGVLPKQALHNLAGSSVHFFDFLYFSDRAPDGVSRLTKSLNGSVFEIYSPTDLDQAIHKMQEEMKSGRKESAPVPAAGG